MEDVEAQIAEKKARLAELTKSRPKGFCSSRLSTDEDVRHEEMIEQLEDEIRQLEQRRKRTS